MDGVDPHPTFGECQLWAPEHEALSAAGDALPASHPDEGHS